MAKLLPSLSRWQIVSLACALALLVGVATFFISGPPAGSGGAGRLSGGDFTLNAASGPLALHDFRGQVVILYFGYASCPDACPTALGATGQALALLTPAELARVQPLFVSVDPDRDTPAALKDYAAFFHPKILAATGSAAQIAELARRYGVYYRRQESSSASGYSVDHSSSLYVINGNGQIDNVLPHGVTPPQIASALRRALAL